VGAEIGDIGVSQGHLSEGVNCTAFGTSGFNDGHFQGGEAEDTINGDEFGVMQAVIHIGKMFGWELEFGEVAGEIADRNCGLTDINMDEEICAVGSGDTCPGPAKLLGGKEGIDG
jgi:hypothetical protein